MALLLGVVSWFACGICVVLLLFVMMTVAFFCHALLRFTCPSTAVCTDYGHTGSWIAVVTVAVAVAVAATVSVVVVEVSGTVAAML